MWRLSFFYSFDLKNTTSHFPGKAGSAQSLPPSAGLCCLSGNMVYVWSDTVYFLFSTVSNVSDTVHYLFITVLIVSDTVYFLFSKVFIVSKNS